MPAHVDVVVIGGGQAGQAKGQSDRKECKYTRSAHQRIDDFLEMLFVGIEVVHAVQARRAQSAMATWISRSSMMISSVPNGRLLAGVLAGITLTMGILPEEIPVILTVFMALGARRIANEGVLTRRMSAIETLGQTSVLCVDKTGTLTQNRMSVRALCARGKLQIIDQATQHIDETYHELVEYLVLASRDSCPA